MEPPNASSRWGCRSDGVAFMYGCDRASKVGFGSDVADHQAAGRSAEATISEKGYSLGVREFP